MGKKRKAAAAPEAGEPRTAQTAENAVATAAAPQAAPPAAPPAQAAAPATVPRPAHVHTDVAPTGLGKQLASAPGRLAKGPLHELCSSFPAAKWAPPAVARSACPHSPAAAVELELARAAALEQLRHKLSSLCAKAGLRNVPLLSFERWRFAAKWAEDEPELAGLAAEVATGGDGSEGQQAATAAAATAAAAAASGGSKGAKPGRKAGGSHATDPVLPYGCLPPAPEPGLVKDLVRCGLAAAAATGVAQELAQASADACARLAKRRHQLASGKPPSCPELQLAFHKHSLDLTCGGRFVRVSRAFYGKLARLYRTHWLEAPGAPAAAAAAAGCSVGLPMEAAAARVAELETAAAAAGRHTQAGGRDGDGAPEGGSGPEDEETPAGGAAAHEGSAGHDTLCAEARIAELEGAAAAATGADDSGSDSGSGSGSVRAELHCRLFALLLRYKSIQGAGFQAAAGPPVFKLLQERLAVGFECFASPLNATFSRFGSAFPDVDGAFGSAGSFFRLQLKHGSYEVNPPFVPALLTASAQRVLAQLQAAEASGGALSFAVLMPGWQEVAGWQLLRGSPFLRHSLLVAAADHGYCDGSSHQARDLYRQSPYDTGLLILQTSAAAARWRVSGPLAQQLQTALAACCPSTAAVERQRKQRGQNDLEWRGLGTPVQKAPQAVPAATAAAAGAGVKAAAPPLPAAGKKRRVIKATSDKQHRGKQQQQQQQQKQQQQQQSFEAPKLHTKKKWKQRKPSNTGGGVGADKP